MILTISSFSFFGYLGYVSTLKSSRNKISPRASTAIFLGYPDGVKGYKMHLLSEYRIVISRDVVFHNDKFPFHYIVAPTDPSLDFFSDFVLPRSLDEPSTDQCAYVPPPAMGFSESVPQVNMSTSLPNISH